MPRKTGVAKKPADWPLAYQRGYQWFFHEKYIVNPSVLIPRPETELLVELALGQIKSDRPEMMADIGTGSGCIIISTANHVPNKSRLAFFGSDISIQALAVAKKNAKNILRKKKISFIQGDLAAVFLKKKKKRENLLITANLPYLTKQELKEPTIKHEPKLALFGQTTLTKKLLKQLATAKIKKSTILLEIGFNQASVIKKFSLKLWAKATITIYKDLSKFDRVLQIKI